MVTETERIININYVAKYTLSHILVCTKDYLFGEKKLHYEMQGLTKYTKMDIQKLKTFRSPKSKNTFIFQSVFLTCHVVPFSSLHAIMLICNFVT